MSNHVLVDKSGGVLTLTLNRPEKKNAITRAMYQTLGDAIDASNHDAELRCVLLRGEGEMFCAGNDMSDFAQMSATAGNASEVTWQGNPLLSALARARLPIVAAVQGRAVGVGVTMLLHCDLVFLSDDVLLTTPFVNLALVPEAASSLTLPGRIGHVRAFSMFVLGEAVNAQSAVAWGLANAAVSRAELQARARAAADSLAAKPPAAVAITKALMRDAAELQRRIDREGQHFVEQLGSPEAKEAFAAFAEKRRPNFV